MSIKSFLEKYPSKSEGKNLNVHKIESPAGNLIAMADDEQIYFVQFEDSKHLDKKVQQICKELDCGLVESENKLLSSLEDELRLYFSGKLKKFNLPLRGFGSEFYKKVWSELQRIPYGETRSYKQQAEAMGRTMAHSRALGGACGANPHLILVPCHRLVAQTARNGGYIAGSDKKEWLLRHEKKYV